MSQPLAHEVGDAACEFLAKLLLIERFNNANVPDHVQREAWLALWSADYHFVDPVADEMEGGSRHCLLARDANEQADAIWPLDYAKTFRTDGTKIDTTRNDFFLLRLTTAATASLRGKTRFSPTRCMSVASGTLTGETIATDHLYAGLIANKWVDIGTWGRGGRFTQDASFGQDLHTAIDFALAQALTDRYSWHAAFGFSDFGPRLLIPTNPLGCLELFKGRDLNPGEKRRSALRHWVNNHYRNRSNDAGVIDYVRDHLRGNTCFIWNGLDCELMVSEYDLEKNEFFKNQAAEWRARRKHNHVRLRLKSKLVAGPATGSSAKGRFIARAT